MIYPLDLLCKKKVDFTDLTSIDDLVQLLKTLTYPYEELKSMDTLFNLLEPTLIKDFITHENAETIFQKVSVKSIYLKLIDDISKKENEILIKPKVIYTICNDVDNLDRKMREIKIGDQVILSIVKISISDLKAIIS